MKFPEKIIGKRNGTEGLRMHESVYFEGEL